MYAIITGASSGLGKSFATELAKRGHHLIMVSLPDPNLKKLAKKLRRKFDVEIVTKETDLSIQKNVLSFAKWINQNYAVNILVNNAGIGGSRRFENVSCSYIDKIVRLNILATTLLTHQLLPNLKEQSQSYILNVSSLAGLSPIGFKTVYPASKAFIHSFSLGLSQELKDTNVSVSVVNPGAMATNEQVCDRIRKQGFLGKLTLLDPDRVARKCIQKILKKDTVIVVNPLSWIALRLVPLWIKLPLMTNAVKRELI